MRKIGFVLLVLMGTGCGWYPFPYRTGDYVAKSDCIEVHADFPINQAALDHNVSEVRRILDEHGVVRVADFCNEFQDIPIAISKNARVNGSDNTGYYNRLRGILLGYASESMLHEFLHEVDATRDLNYLTTESHTGWKQKGYWIDSLEYKNASSDLKWNLPNRPFFGPADGNGD